MSQFTVVRVPANFSPEDDECNCVPDPDARRCYSVSPRERGKGPRAPGAAPEAPGAPGAPGLLVAACTLALFVI